MAIGGVSVYVYFYRKGQFDDPEDVKYQMFRVEEEEERLRVEQEKKTNGKDK